MRVKINQLDFFPFFEPVPLRSIMTPNKSYFSNGFIKPTKRLYKFLSLRGIRLSEAFFMQKIIERDR